MEILKRFNDLTKELQATSSRNEKEALLLKYKEDLEVKRILNFLYNPYIITGISKKKAEKFKGKRKLNNFQFKDLFGDTYENSYTNITKMLEYFKNNNTGKDENLIELDNYAQINEPYGDLIYSIITKDLKLGVQPATLNKVYGKGFIPTFDCMLAEKYFDAPDRYVPEGTEFYLEQKFDGVRCLLINKESGPELFSRQGQRFEGVVELEQEARSLPTGFVYDGEILLENVNNLKSKDLYRATMKVIGSDAKFKDGLIFNCFDVIPLEDFKQGYCEMPFRDRRKLLESCFTDNLNKHLVLVKTLYKGQNKSQIEYWLNEVTGKDGEGVMIKLANAPYESKRSKGMLKVKKFQSCDVRVISLQEGTGINLGKLGAVTINFTGPDGKTYTCDVGTGFSKEEREYYWQHKEELLGKIIEIGYFEITSNQQGTYSLRFPTFKWVRNDKSEISMY